MAEDTANTKKKSFFGFGKQKTQEIEEDPYPEKSSPVDKSPSPDEAVGFEECVLETPEDNSPVQETETDPFLLLAKLKQRIEILERNKSEMNRSFSEMNKTVGELRSRILEQEKYIDILESKSNIANDLMRTIDPAQLGKDFEEQKAKIDAIDAKIDSFISLSDSVKTEISAVDSKIASIGTPEEIRNMNKDMQNMLKEIIGRESRLSARLERSENLFYDMQKNYTESLRFFSTVDAINSSMKSIMSEYIKMDVALKNYVPSDLFSRRISEIEHFLKHMENKYSTLLNDSGIRENSLEGESVIISDSVKNIKAAEEIDSIVKTVEKGPSRTRVSRPVNPADRSVFGQKNLPDAPTKPEANAKSESKKKSDYDEMIFSRSY